MVFLRRDGDEGERRIVGAGVYLRAPELRDFTEWAEVRAQSRAFLTPWEPTWSEDELTKPSFRYRIRRYLQDMEDDKAYPYFVFRMTDERLVGGVTLSNVRRGVAMAASLGYWVGEAFKRRGYTSAAVRAVVRHAFQDLGLHRVEAACQPDNFASQGVLRTCGFDQEGLARQYLRINGAWRDHLLFARIRTEDPA
ncbi:MAG: GNAT family N-acetyltransferase [Hyphomonadaceae bacterium]